MSTNFNNLQNSVEKNALVLPDFQRKFVWNEDKMRSLYTSVLCEMPIGSYLTLKSKDRDFSCKKIGAKPKSCQIKLESSEAINYLIDGQQRITSLFAGFTTYFFREFRQNVRDIASKDLIKVYFVKIPAPNNKNVLDLFNVRDLSFNYNKRKNNHEYFKSTDLGEFIDSESMAKIFDLADEELPDVNDSSILEKLENYCEKNDDGFYRIPLQLFSAETDEVNNCLRSILDYIASHHADQMKDLSASQKRNKQENWKENIKTYINSCLSNLDLNLIEVENSDKIRAIDIYSNLNQGGVGLSVFDLVMAKVGSISSVNYYDYLIDLIQKETDYPNNLLSDVVRGWIEQSHQSYKNSTEISNVINKKNDIDNAYINVFLNILSLYTNKVKGGDFDESYVKQEKILAMTAEDIFNNTAKTCEAINRALFFFQTRCGIRRISDLNYKAQLTLVAYIFLDDKYWLNTNVHKFLEYWYWISIFAYMYPSNQDVSILKEIPQFIKYFNNQQSSKNPLSFIKQNYYPKVLNEKFYSDKDVLTMEHVEKTEKYPPAKMRDFVCQYYLSKGYYDFFDEKIMINFLCPYPLEMHHIVTLGSSPELKIGQSTKEIRGKKDNPYNSPLNMMLITKKSNGMISDMRYDEYSKDSDVIKILPGVGCPVENVSSNKQITNFLVARYNNLKADLNRRLADLYSSLENIEFKYE